MPITRIFFGLLCGLSVQLSYAEPPFEILRSCIDEKPHSKQIHIEDIDNGRYTEAETNCEEIFHITYKQKVYGVATCNDQQYIIIDGKKINLANASNKSINPEIKPGGIHPSDAAWLKIDFNGNSYLCINSPLSREGKGSAVGQYYIVEHAFDNYSDPIVSFYFFDKSIIPVTSEHF